MPPSSATDLLETSLIKVRVTIGPISLDVEDSPDKLTLLVTKIVESFISHKIISLMAGQEIATEVLKSSRAAP